MNDKARDARSFGSTGGETTMHAKRLHGMTTAAWLGALLIVATIAILLVVAQPRVTTSPSPLGAGAGAASTPATAPAAANPAQAGQLQLVGGGKDQPGGKPADYAGGSDVKCPGTRECP
jgi:hypothetical protein